MHAILASVGTDGDVFPYLGLGARLRSRGHRVTLIANECYRAPALEHGFAFHALVSNAEADAFLAHPDVWHPIKSAFHGARWGVRFTGRQFALLADVARANDAVLVASPAIFAARLVQERFSRPMATIALQPWMIHSIHEPPVLPGLTLPRWAPAPLGRLYFRTIDALGDLLVGHQVNRLRAKLGLDSVHRIFQWWLSPQLVLGLFPDWYGPRQPDWPPQIRLAGFPIYDGRPRSQLSAELLEFCHAGPPPIAFTLGTGMRHAAEFFREAVGACRRIGARGLFLTKFANLLPRALPASVRHCAFAPFQELLPHCSVVVHHGGIGTVARGLAAGIPQLILPLAWDQLDNAARVERLGTGTWLKARRRSAAHLAAALGKLLMPETKERCRAVADRFGSGDALDTAADWLEALAR